MASVPMRGNALHDGGKRDEMWIRDRYQAVGRDDCAGTATAEMHHGILRAMPSGLWIWLVGMSSPSSVMATSFCFCRSVSIHIPSDVYKRQSRYCDFQLSIFIFQLLKHWQQ